MVYILSWAGIASVIMVAMSESFDPTFSFFVGLIISGIIILMVLMHKAKKHEESLKHIRFDEDGTATLLQRSSISQEWIKLQNIHEVYHKYNPSQLVYTGATVGGVTTGGFHETQASYSEKSLGTSGRCKLMGKKGDRDYVIIKEIVLSDSMVEDAKNTPYINKFLSGNKLILKYDGPETKLTENESLVLQKAIMTCDEGLRLDVTQRAYLAAQLTRNDCERILSWIGGK